MRLSEAIVKHETKTLPIPFDGGAILNVEYKPARFTVRQLEDMQKRREARVVIEQFLRVVEGWDLTDADEVPIPLETESLLDIDIDILTKIIKAVSEDQTVDEDAKKR